MRILMLLALFYAVVLFVPLSIHSYLIYLMSFFQVITALLSVLWYCWLGIRKSIRPVKIDRNDVLAWLPVWGHRWGAKVWHIVQSSWCYTVTPIISCFIKIQIGLTFLMLAYPGCSGKEAVKRMSCQVITIIRIRRVNGL